MINYLKTSLIETIITKMYHLFIRVLNLTTKLMSAIFKDQGEAVVMVKPPNIWYLNVHFTGHPDLKLRHVWCQKN